MKTRFVYLVVMFMVCFGVFEITSSLKARALESYQDAQRASGLELYAKWRESIRQNDDGIPKHHAIVATTERIDDNSAKIGVLTFDRLRSRSIEIQSVYIPPGATNELEYQYLDGVSTNSVGPSSEILSQPEFSEARITINTVPKANAVILTWTRIGPKEKVVSTAKLIIPLALNSQNSSVTGVFHSRGTINKLTNSQCFPGDPGCEECDPDVDPFCNPECTPGAPSCGGGGGSPSCERVSVTCNPDTNNCGNSLCTHCTAPVSTISNCVNCSLSCTSPSRACSTNDPNKRCP